MSVSRVLQIKSSWIHVTHVMPPTRKVVVAMWRLVEAESLAPTGSSLGDNCMSEGAISASHCAPGIGGIGWVWLSSDGFRRDGARLATGLRVSSTRWFSSPQGYRYMHFVWRGMDQRARQVSRREVAVLTRRVLRLSKGEGRNYDERSDAGNSSSQAT